MNSRCLYMRVIQPTQMTLEQVELQGQSSHCLIEPNFDFKNCCKLCKYIIIDIEYCMKFQGRWIDLLTSITSKMVWWHLMYALLTYFMVFLGSMGTGEDLFYKCWAPSEDLSTHGYFPRNFSLEFELLTMSIGFLIEIQYIHSPYFSLI